MDDEILDRILDAFGRLIESGQTPPPELLDGLRMILRDRLEQLPPEPPIPSGAEMLWILAGGNPEAFVSYLKSIPDPALNELYRNPEELERTIQTLRRRVTIPAGEVEDGIPRAPLQSSNVYGFSYNPRNQRLFVRFNSGSVYEYEGVPAQIFKIFSAGAVPAKTTGSNQWGMWFRGKIPSLGAAFYEMIRNSGYPYQKVA